MLKEEMRDRYDQMYICVKFPKLKKKIIDKYINSNRKNHFVHEELLSELTGALMKN